MNDVKRSMDRARSGGMGGAARRLGALAGALLAGGALAQTGGVQWVQPDVPEEVTTPTAMVDETPGLWFVELSGAPTADGGSAASVATQHKTFRDAVLKSGVAVRERQEFSALFNGFSVAASARDLGKIRALGGVAAIHPVMQVTRPQGGPSTADLFSALGMTGADVVQNTMGLTGRGITVGVIDTGIDYDNADLGGDGVPRSNSAMFPNARVVKGWDFVGDAYNADPESAGYNITLTPDARPDDCAGHGTHVAGIVGGRGVITGVAPGAKLASYRVFGCEGSTNDDVILAALERALKDKVNVVNMSLGSPFGWPNSPTAKASDRLVKRGIVVVASAGNNQSYGLYSTGGPSAGAEVISVASVDNVGAYIDYFEAGGQRFGWLPATGAGTPPASGTLPLARTGTTTTTNDGCTALPAGSLAGQAVLIRRGTCSFYVKSLNAQNAGAAAVVLYNNTSGFISPTVAGSVPAITIPVVSVLAGRRRRPRRARRGRRRHPHLDGAAGHLPQPDRQPHLELQLLRPDPGPRLQAGHRGAGREHLLHLPPRARRPRLALRHLDVLAVRRRRGGPPPRVAPLARPVGGAQPAPQHRRAPPLVRRPDRRLPRHGGQARAPVSSASTTPSPPRSAPSRARSPSARARAAR